MTDQSTSKPPVWFWIVSVVALLWNGMGVNAYLQQAYMTDAFKAQYNAEQLEAVANTPAWVTAAFAIAVFAGLLGCIGLLLRKKWAKPLFLLSLLGIIGQNIHGIFMTNNVEIFGNVAVIFTVLVIVIAIFLIWFANKGIAKGWLK